MKSFLRKTALFGVAATMWIAGTASFAAAQDAKDTLRVAMYVNATTVGHVYGFNYIWPHMYWWEGSYDSFVRIDEKGQVLPFAASSWENVNPTTWRVTFRDDVVFWSGRKNDAENIVAAFDYLHTEDGKVAGIMRNMKLASYRAIDSNTVEFVTPNPDPLFIPKLAAFYVIDMKAFNEMGIEEFAVHPVASGPFEILSWTDQEQKSVAFKQSWRPAKVANMIILNVPEAPTRVAALLSGEVDIAFNLGSDDVRTVEAEGHTAAVEGSPFAGAIALFTYDFANKWGGKAPFSDRRVRQAANYAINKDALVNQLLGGMAKASGQPAVPSTFGYNPDVKPYPYDPAKASQLLADAGYPNGFDILMETRGVYGAAADIFQVIASDLSKVGINVEVQLMPYAEIQKRVQGSTWEGDMTSQVMFFSPMQDASIPFTVYGCNTIRPPTSCIPALTSLIDAQDKEFDPVKRLVILQELMKRSHEEAMALYLFEGFDVTGVAKRVQGYKNWNKVIHYENMSIEPVED